MAVASEQVLWRVPPTILHICLTVAVFWANGCCFRKGSVEGSVNYSLHLSPKWLLLHKSSLEGSANCALHLSPSLLMGSKLRELLTCLTHTNPVRRKWPIMSLLLRYSLGLFSTEHLKDFFHGPICCMSGLFADSSLKAGSSGLVVEPLPHGTTPWAGNDSYNVEQEGCFSSFLKTFQVFWERTTRRFNIKNYTSGAVLGVVLVGVGRCLVPRLNLFWFQSDTIDTDVSTGGKCFGTKNTDNEHENEVAVKQHPPHMQHPKV